MTTEQCLHSEERRSPSLKTVIRDLQLLALTAELPSAPKVCRELAELEECLKDERTGAAATH